jgi:hypothetical protein
MRLASDFSFVAVLQAIFHIGAAVPKHNLNVNQRVWAHALTPARVLLSVQVCDDRLRHFVAFNVANLPSPLIR